MFRDLFGSRSDSYELKGLEKDEYEDLQNSLDVYAISRSSSVSPEKAEREHFTMPGGRVVITLRKPYTSDTVYMDVARTIPWTPGYVKDLLDELDAKWSGSWVKGEPNPTGSFVMHRENNKREKEESELKKRRYSEVRTGGLPPSSLR